MAFSLKLGAFKTKKFLFFGLFFFVFTLPLPLYSDNHCGGPSLLASGFLFDPSYDAVEYSPEGYPTQHFRIYEQWADGRSFDLYLTFLNEGCVQSNFDTNSLRVNLPPGSKNFSIRFTSPTHFDVIDDGSGAIIAGRDVVSMPLYSRVHFYGTVPGGFSSFSTSYLFLKLGATAPVFEDTLEKPDVCNPFFLGGSSRYLFDNYERAEYVDGLLRVHLRLKSPYNDGRFGRLGVATGGEDCSINFPALNTLPQVGVTPYVRYYSFRMMSPTVWQMWDDENNKPFSCEHCSGVISENAKYVSWYGNVDVSASFFITTAFPPTKITNRPPEVFGLSQRKSDGILDLGEGASTAESEVYFFANLNDPEGKKVKLRIEVGRVGQDFSGSNVFESVFKESGSEISLSKNDLNDGFYKWRAQAVDEDGAIGEWKEFGTILGGVDFEVKKVPFYTQVRSPYPPRSTEEEWADDIYANGSGNTGRDGCGETIADCGCAITSIVMILRYYGVDVAVDGQEVQPFNIDRWLLANGGYVGNGNVSWPKIVEYSKDQSGFARLKYDGRRDVGDNESSTFADLKSKTDEYVNQDRPVIIKSKSFGHFLVVTEKLSPTYAVLDPAWFNTKKLDEAATSKALHIRDYNNIFDGVRLFSKNTIGGGVDSIAFNLASPAELLITDPLGRRLGKDSMSGIFYNEIPDASYGYDGIGNADLELPAETHEVKSVWIPSAEGGDYDVKVVGTGEGKYTLSSEVYRDGGAIYESSIIGDTKAGEIDAFTLDFNKTGGDTKISATTTLFASADTFIKRGAPNQNEGDTDFLRVKSAGNNKILLKFDEEEIRSALGGGVLKSALLVLFPVYVAENWDKGRALDIHKITKAWSEFGATWNCPDDLNIENQQPDCGGYEWNTRDGFYPWITNPTDSAIIKNNLTGDVSFDITKDLDSFLSGEDHNGWIIKKREEDGSGHIEFGSRESIFAPKLIINYEI